MGGKETACGVGDTGEEIRAAQRVVTCALRDDGADGVGLQLGLSPVLARGDDSAHLRHAAQRRLVDAAGPCDLGQDLRAQIGACLHLRQMTSDMMARLMTHDKGQLIGVGAATAIKPMVKMIAGWPLSSIV